MTTTQDATTSPRPSTWLLEHASNVYSQCGEDGIIGKILEVLPNNDRWLVEFGAWDGLVHTNSRHLIETRAYSAVLIEGAADRAADLKKNYAGNAKVIPMNKLVGFDGPDTLDNLLAQTPIPEDFDLLSIDIDGNDYHVWKALNTYKPKLIVIEFNPTVPTELHYVQPADASLNRGCGLMPLVELGREKGYELVCVTMFNAFFVRRQDFPLFEIRDNSPFTLRTNTDAVTYLYSGYDGKVMIEGGRRLPWHGIALRESRVQHLPAALRTYPGNFSRLQKLLFKAFKLLPGRGKVKSPLGGGDA